MIETMQQLISSTVRKTGKRALSEADIEDLTQDVNIVLMTPGTSRSLGSFDADRGRKLSTFVFMVTQSVVIDALRARLRRPVHTPLPEGSTGSPFDSSDTALDKMLERERIEMLSLAIESLPKSERDLAHTLFTGNVSIEEHATALGVSVNSLYVRKCRIIKRLVRTLSAQAA